MTAILDRVNRKREPFRPQNEPEFFALRLARLTGGTIGDCVAIVQRHPRETVLRAYKVTVRSHPTATLFWGRFLESLRARDGSGTQMVERTLAAFKVERRAIAVAVFHGAGIEHVQLRQLSSNPRKADASALGFAHWILDEFQTEAAAIEEIPEFKQTRRGRLTLILVESLRKRAVSLWLPRKIDLFAAFGIPPVRTRKEIRATVRSIWPILGDSKRCTPLLDAAAIGLAVQTERPFEY